MKKTTLILVTTLVSIWAWAQQPTMKTVTVNGVSFNMIEVKGGRFNMGGTAEQYNCEDVEFPIHVVSLKDYYIGETEVTQALWQAVMGSNPSGFQGNDKLPVERVTWQECQDFVNKLTTLTGITFRLPTESEWEFAARGGIYTKYYQYSGSNNIDDVAWWGDCGDTTHEVATKSPNELGLYDMSGNVFEWCQDYYGDYDMMPAESPQGPATGETRVRRGGSWGGTLNGPRISYRNYELENIRYNYIGLRLAAINMDNNLPTPVVNPQKKDRLTNTAPYNIQGQRINDHHQGVVIEDGVKHIAK